MVVTAVPTRFSPRRKW